MKKIGYLLVFVSVAAFLLIAAGLVLDGRLGYPVPAGLNARWISLVVTGLVGVLGATRLARVDGRRFLFASAFAGLVAAVTVYAANIAGALVLPRWPLNGLMGVKPGAYWRGDGPNVVGFNSWGQRDKERSLRPAPGITRFAFVGDSFLAEGPRPLATLVEDGLSGVPAEVLNLGISSTAPDEYHYRTKNVAIPLGVKHVFFFFYNGNDLMQDLSLPGTWGVAAVYPRDSVLSKLGLKALNHALTNRQRPFLVAWGAAGTLTLKEAEREKTVRAADDATLKTFLLGLVNESSRARLKPVLDKPEAKAFLAAIRRPDENLYRSYLVEAALAYAAGETQPKDWVSEDLGYAWVKRTSDVCKARGVGFTLVMVPEAFQVDTRMQGVYGFLGDMKRFYRAKQEAADRLAARAKKDRIAVLDLFPVLNGRPGLYLNLDGHWSEEGRRLVAATMASAVLERLP